MDFYMSILFILKIFLFLDLPICLVLFCILVKSDSYYLYESVSLSPKIILWGYAMNYCFLFFSAGLMDRVKHPAIIMYLPYLLLAIYITYIGILIFKNKEFKISVPFMIHGLLSFVTPFYFYFTAPSWN